MTTPLVITLLFLAVASGVLLGICIVLACQRPMVIRGAVVDRASKFFARFVGDNANGSDRTQMDQVHDASYCQE